MESTSRRRWWHTPTLFLAMADRATGAVYTFHNNELGTPELMTDSTNTVVWEGISKPFGETAVNSGSTVVNNFRFQGQYYDAETGLHYNGQRYYDPKTGRYLTPDPIGLAGGVNPYVYVGNDPINGVDPRGLWTVSVGVFVSGALGVGGGGGLELSFGYSQSAGFSFSLAGTAQGGAIAGGSASLFGGLTITDACSVNQLNGTSYQFGRAGFGMGPSYAVEVVKGSDYHGGTFYGGIGPGYTANSLTVSTTSAIIQYDSGTLSVGNIGTSSIWSKNLY